MNNDEKKELEEEYLDNESEGEVPSSDYSDYEEEYPEEEYEQPSGGFTDGLKSYNQYRKQQKTAKEAGDAKKKKDAEEKAKTTKNQPLANDKNAYNNSLSYGDRLKNKRNAKGDEATKQKLNSRKDKTLGSFNNRKGEVANQSTSKASSSLKKKSKEASSKAKKTAAKEKAKKVTKETTKKVKQKAKQALASLLKKLAANPYFWIAIGILLLVILFVLLVAVLWAAYDDSEGSEENSYSDQTTVCTYNINGADMTNIKVHLLECDGSDYIDGESLVDFDKYITGVVYAENGGGPSEALKAQAIAAKSYVLNRPSVMGGNIKLEEENGQYVLSIRNCTNDQVYCDPDKGCWSNSKTAGATVHSGEDSSKAYSKPPLSQDSNIRTAVAEVSDKLLVDSSGNPYGASFNSTTQTKWNNLANSGSNYSSILSSSYPDATLSTLSCTTTGSSGGGCSTSTPIKLADGEDYVITSKFGYRTAPTAGASTYHQGVDLSATTGTPVYSVFDGTVKTSTDSYGTAGKAVLVDHDIDGDGKVDYTTQYYHLSKRDVEVGDVVTGGTKIGEVGSTGASTGPHLHFGLQNSTGKHIDPLDTLNGLKSKSSMFDTAEVCNNVTTNNNGGTFSGNFPYYNQCTGDWSSKIICDAGDYSGGRCVSSNTVCKSGCGYTSFSMIASGFNNDSSINPSNVVDFVAPYSNNPGGGAVTDAALINTDVLNHYNLKAEVLFPRGSGDSIESKKNKIVSALQSGKAVELLVPGHFVALVGIDSNGKITLHDPGNVENVGTYTIDELHTLFKVKRASKCSGCSDTQFFVYAVAYRKRIGGES